MKRDFLPTAAFIIGESAFVLFYADLLHYSKVNIFQPSGSSFFRWVVIYLVYDPRKGAEINVRPHDMPFHILSPQGDDNPLRCQNSLFIYNCNLSPQGDDNLGPVYWATYKTSLQLIPARGQKTPHLFLMRSFSFANLSSLFSVGCLSMNGMIAAAVIFFLLQLLHSDKICYNKANSEHLSQNRQIHFPFIVQFFHNP